MAEGESGCGAVIEPNPPVSGIVTTAKASGRSLARVYPSICANRPSHDFGGFDT